MDDKEQQKETQQPVTPPQGPIDKRKIGIGLILVIILIIGAAEFSSNSVGSTVPATKPKAAPVKSQPTEPGLIGNFERQTTEDAQELARIKAQKEALAQTLTAAQAAPSPFPAATYPYGTEAHAQTGETPSVAALERQRQIAAAGYYPQTASRTQTSSVPDQIAAERKKREYESLYASNVALDLRSQPKSASQPADTPEVTTPIEQVRIPPDRSMKQPVSDSTDTAPDRKKAYDFDSATGKPYRLFEGRIIETVLTNRLTGTFSGPVDCMVTTDVYSHDNQTLLIPQGSRILGKVSAVQSGQQQRLFVAFHRIIMPDGYSVSLDQFTGLNQIGETGLRDLVNHHYLQIFGSSLALAAIGGVAQIGNGASAFTYDPMSQVRNGMSQSMAESSQRVLDRFLNQLPTFLIRERTRVKIYLSDDLLLPAYANHTMPRDL